MTDPLREADDVRERVHAWLGSMMTLTGLENWLATASREHRIGRNVSSMGYGAQLLIGEYRNGNITKGKLRHRLSHLVQRMVPCGVCGDLMGEEDFICNFGWCDQCMEDACSCTQDVTRETIRITLRYQTTDTFDHPVVRATHLPTGYSASSGDYDAQTRNEIEAISRMKRMIRASRPTHPSCPIHPPHDEAQGHPAFTGWDGLDLQGESDPIPGGH